MPSLRYAGHVNLILSALLALSCATAVDDDLPGGGGGGNEPTTSSTTSPKGGSGGGTACDPLDPSTVTCGQGICLSTVPACDEHGLPVPCLPGTPLPEELCNGADDTCDGLVDEGCSCPNGAVQPCYTGSSQTQGIGECKDGAQTCVNGQWGACVGDVTPSVESCDGLDNSCNGSVDEGNPGGGNGCLTGIPGVCAQGMYICANGDLACQPITPPSPEVCDGQDNNCNGSVDEGVSSGQEICGDGLDNDCNGLIDCTGSCPHSPCIVGPSSTPFSSGCDAPSSCVALICAADSYCCSTDWDSYCVDEVATICGLTCV